MFYSNLKIPILFWAGSSMQSRSGGAEMEVRNYNTRSTKDFNLSLHRGTLYTKIHLLQEQTIQPPSHKSERWSFRRAKGKTTAIVGWGSNLQLGWVHQPNKIIALIGVPIVHVTDTILIWMLINKDVCIRLQQLNMFDTDFVFININFKVKLK